MIILHNSLDKESRAFVQAHGVGATIFDWYKGGREAFWALGHTHGVSAFPSVIIDTPTYKVPAIPDFPAHTVPRSQVAFRKPDNMGTVASELARINVKLAKSADEGLPVTPLTLANMSEVKT